MSNWFLPFNIQQSQLQGFISENADNKGIIDSITKSIVHLQLRQVFILF